MYVYDRSCDHAAFYNKRNNHVVSAHLFVLVRRIKCPSQTVQIINRVCFDFYGIHGSSHEDSSDRIKSSVLQPQNSKLWNIWSNRQAGTNLTKQSAEFLTQSVMCVGGNTKCKPVQRLVIYSAPLAEALSLSPSVGTLLYWQSAATSTAVLPGSGSADG